MTINPDEEKEPENQSLRNQIIDILKAETENIGIYELELKLNYDVTREEFNKEIQRLLQDGYIFEPKQNFLRWLG